MEQDNLDNTIPYIKDNTVSTSFYLTFAFLLMTAIITFIEAIRTNSAKIRHILNLVAGVSVVTAFFYAKFMNKLNGSMNNNEQTYKEINITRYSDWVITTPFLLLVLCLVLAYNNHSTMRTSLFLSVLIVNYAMLGVRYFGEVGKLNRRLSQLIGIIFFIILYGTIYFAFLYNNYKLDNAVIYWAFVIFWGLYGVVYDFRDEHKVISYYILDIFSKCFVGWFLWAYLTKAITIF